MAGVAGCSDRVNFRPQVVIWVFILECLFQHVQACRFVHKDELSVIVQHQNRSFSQCAGCEPNSMSVMGEFWCNLTREPLSTEEVQLICRECEAS